MNLNSKKPEKRPLYVYYIIAVVIIILLNVFALPAISERSVKETDYTTFLKAVDRGKVYEATINSDYIYYTMKVDGNDVYCKTVSVDDKDLVSHLYDAGVSIEGTAPQRQSLLWSLTVGYILPIAVFILTLFLSYCMSQINTPLFIAIFSILSTEKPVTYIITYPHI